MKPRLVSLVVAEGIAVDQFTGRATAFNIMDHVLVPALPAQLTRMAAISFYELADEADSFHERVRFVGPDGEQTISSETPLHLAARTPNQVPNGHRSIHMLWRAKIGVLGDYRLIVERSRDGGQWEELTSACLTVVQQQHPLLNAQASPVSIPSVAPTPAGAGSQT